MANQIRTVRVTATGIVGNPTPLGAMATIAGWNLVAAGAAANAQIRLTNAAATGASGDPLDELSIPANTSNHNWFNHNGGGLALTTPCHITLSGAGAILYIYYA